MEILVKLRGNKITLSDRQEHNIGKQIHALGEFVG